MIIGIFSGYTDSTVLVVVVYCVMFVIAAAGNLSVVVTLFRSRRHRRSRISLMICHLAVADLIVAFFMIPLEVFIILNLCFYMDFHLIYAHVLINREYI